MARSRYVLASALWCVAALAIKPFFAYIDFGAFYANAIERILAGAPLDIYSFGARPPHSDLLLVVANPPIWFFFLAPWYALGSALGISDFHAQAGVSLGQAWMLVVSLPFDLLLCGTVLHAVEMARPLPEPRRFALYLCLLFSPLLWMSTVRFGHGNETLMVLSVLLAVIAGEGGKPAWAGAFWGLALGIKLTAIVPLLTWLAWGAVSRRVRATAVAGGVAAVVAMAPVLPYLIFRREPIVYALLRFETLRPIGGYVVWQLLPERIATALSSRANLAILILAAAVGAWLGRRRDRGFLASGGAWALVIGQAALLLLGKAVYVWYALAASCFLFLAWERDDRSDRLVPAVPVAITIALWVLQGSALDGLQADPGIVARSAGWGLALVGTIALAAIRLRRASES